LGDFRTLPAAVSARLAGLRLIVIGPNASGLAPAEAIAIDTGRAGIHEGGTAFRLDDVPLPLTAVLPGPATVAEVLAEVTRSAVGR
jgi:formylmethanofuran dehydrogenase subunit B